MIGAGGDVKDEFPARRLETGLEVDLQRRVCQHHLPRRPPESLVEAHLRAAEECPQALRGVLQ